MKCKRCGSARSIEVGGEGLICFDCYIKTAVKAEREACAKLVESKCEYQRPALVIHSSPEFRLYADTCKELATAIRKRGDE